MFQSYQRVLTQATGPQRTRQLLKRALLFGGGLVLLWLVVQLAPSSSLSEAVPDPTSANRIAEPSPPASPMAFSWGYLGALALLVGGGAFALYLRQRTREGGGMEIPIQSLGHMTLAPNQQLRLVRCRGDVLLLGVTSGQITLLKSYAEEDIEAQPEPASLPTETPSIPADSPGRPPTASGRFARVLHQQLARDASTQQEEAPC